MTMAASAVLSEDGTDTDEPVKGPISTITTTSTMDQMNNHAPLTNQSYHSVDSILLGQRGGVAARTYKNQNRTLLNKHDFYGDGKLTSPRKCNPILVVETRRMGRRNSSDSKSADCGSSEFSEDVSSFNGLDVRKKHRSLKEMLKTYGLIGCGQSSSSLTTSTTASSRPKEYLNNKNSTNNKPKDINNTSNDDDDASHFGSVVSNATAASTSKRKVSRRSSTGSLAELKQKDDESVMSARTTTSTTTTAKKENGLKLKQISRRSSTGTVDTTATTTSSKHKDDNDCVSIISSSTTKRRSNKKTTKNDDDSVSIVADQKRRVGRLHRRASVGSVSELTIGEDSVSVASNSTARRRLGKTKKVQQEDAESVSVVSKNKTRVRASRRSSVGSLAEVSTATMNGGDGSVSLASTQQRSRNQTTKSSKNKKMKHGDDDSVSVVSSSKTRTRVSRRSSTGSLAELTTATNETASVASGCTRASTRSSNRRRRGSMDKTTTKKKTTSSGRTPNSRNIGRRASTGTLSELVGGDRDHHNKDKTPRRSTRKKALTKKTTTVPTLSTTLASHLEHGRRSRASRRMSTETLRSQVNNYTDQEPRKKSSRRSSANTTTTDQLTSRADHGPSTRHRVSRRMSTESLRSQLINNTDHGAPRRKASRRLSTESLRSQASNNSEQHARKATRRISTCSSVLSQLSCDDSTSKEEQSLRLSINSQHSQWSSADETTSIISGTSNSSDRRRRLPTRSRRRRDSITSQSSQKSKKGERPHPTIIRSMSSQELRQMLKIEAPPLRRNNSFRSVASTPVGDGGYRDSYYDDEIRERMRPELPSMFRMPANYSTSIFNDSFVVPMID